MKYTITLCALILFTALYGQTKTAQLNGLIQDKNGQPIPNALVQVDEDKKTLSNLSGAYAIDSLKPGAHKLFVKAYGFQSHVEEIKIQGNTSKIIELSPHSQQLKEVVISGTLKEVSKAKSPVNVEVYSQAFFKKNPTPNIFDALQNVNGVRPQLNCQVCNTGDIHINGLEGPYTMVLIDGMPIVSSLSTVYGLSGIPNAMIERVEIVKGPASSLYGSEAVGGLINIITKSPQKALQFSADAFGTSWGELNLDLGFKNRLSSVADILTGINYYQYDNIIDNNNDNFTDVTLQQRLSVFQKWQFHRKSNKQLSFATRYLTEDRWGGELNWTPEFRGGTDIYGESIITHRWEFISNYELPTKEHIQLQSSYNVHKQNSVYGDTWYIADQQVAYSQLLWDKQVKKHDLLAGLALRYTYYDDNTPATATTDTVSPENLPDRIWLPGIFLQDNITVNDHHDVLLGARYDYNSEHGNIFTPRFAWKWSPNKKNIFRLNAGTGFRVVNLFTEDHAALTGARVVEIVNDLAPEESYNANLNYVRKFYPSDDSFVGLDASAWYTYFTNQIIPDYDTDPNKIIYDNLNGFAQSAGVSLNVDVVPNTNWKFLVGGTLMDVSFHEDDIKERPFLTENWTGTWSVSYKVDKWHTTFDYTGNIYGSMRLPVLGDLDPRSEESPIWSLQNIQFTYNKPQSMLSIFGGVKNLLNWTPNKGNPFIIARSHDPFDNGVDFDGDGNVIATASNPYALTFDPSYVYAPNQGIRFFVGLRINVQ